MNYGRVRRLASRYCWGVEKQIDRLEMSQAESLNEFKEGGIGYAHYTLKNDWEVILVFLTRLRRCLVMLQKIGSGLDFDDSFITRFDQTVPNLKELRDYEEHFDDYSLGIGRNKRNNVWGYLESYNYGSGGFENGIGGISIEACRSAALIVWEAVIHMEDSAKKLGYLTWDQRYGNIE